MLVIPTNHPNYVPVWSMYIFLEKIQLFETPNISQLNILYWLVDFFLEKTFLSHCQLTHY